MKISEVEKILKNAKEKNGDIDIVVAKGMGESFEISHISIDHFRDDYSPYARLIITNNLNR